MIDIEDITKIAEKSRMKFRLAAIVLKNDKLVGMGYNRPFVTRELAGRGYRSVHAEIDAIRKMEHSNHSDRLRMVVVRLKRDGTFGKSKPCKRCLKAIKLAGIETVFYMDENGHWASIHRNYM